jgi:hypothetical protein
MIDGLEKKEVNFDIYANKLLKDNNLLHEYFDGLTSKDQIYMENCFHVLRLISEKNPNFLYSHWDFFVNYMRSENHYHKTAAVMIISNLTAVDKQKRFEKLFDEFFSLLKSEKTMAPMYLLKNTGKIVKHKPNLEEKIIDIFLNIDSIHPGKQIELIKSAIIESFSEFFDKSKNKEKIIDFIQNQLNSKSPKTKKLAKEFLEKHSEK